MADGTDTSSFTSPSDRETIIIRWGNESVGAGHDVHNDPAYGAPGKLPGGFKDIVRECSGFMNRLEFFVGAGVFDGRISGIRFLTTLIF